MSFQLYSPPFGIPQSPHNRTTGSEAVFSLPKFLSLNDSLFDGSDLVLRLDGFGNLISGCVESPRQVRLDWQFMSVEGQRSTELVVNVA